VAHTVFQVSKQGSNHSAGLDTVPTIMTFLEGNCVKMAATHEFPSALLCYFIHKNDNVFGISTCMSATGLMYRALPNRRK
jgi:hypothetical protein